MKIKDFVHLKVHSDYSINDGLNKIKSFVIQAKNFGMSALAITDFTNIFGLVKFFKYANKFGIKPIIGSDFLILDENINICSEITILAANNLGYKNLISLISDAYRYGYCKFGPSISYMMLKKYNKGLILISGGVKGDIGQCLIYSNYKLLEKTISFYKINFHNRYYLSLTRTFQEEEKSYIKFALDIALSYDLPVVATNDVKFIKYKDFYAHQIKVAIQKNIKINEIEKKYKYRSNQYMKNQKEMYELFSDIPESLINSVEISKRCNVNINFTGNFLPKFKLKNSSSIKELYKKAKYGLKERLRKSYPDTELRKIKYQIYYNRLLNEIKIIDQMKFPDYFLIVMDFIKWAKKNNIPVGPGRGSGAGSLVAYVLKITNIDPIIFNLIFERFLNPERVSMPDLDIDFCMKKRDLVINYISNKYGAESVSQIITFGTMTARAAIRDVGRVLGYRYSFINKIAKLIPPEPGITLKKAFYKEDRLKKMYFSNEDIKNLVDTASKLEGTIRNISKHAGGIVIAPEKITNFIPIFCDKEDKILLTQLDKNDIESFGLVKFDFLGLRTLTIIDSTIKLIKKNKINKNFDIAEISLTDKKIFNLLNRGNTKAIFQLESPGMKDLVLRLKPDCFEDLIALIALFRPGPLKSGMVNNFINRKHGIEKIYYPDKKWNHDLLKPILKATYGIIIYQEQVMQIAQTLAGYNLGKADILRRAMSKKNLKEMYKQREIFKAKSEVLGINRTLSMKIFDLMEKFAGYGFNKSHSTAYALIAYQTLWLKTYYPKEFIISTMNSDINNMDKIVELINECNRMNINIIPPNINISKYNFYIDDNKNIIYGLGAIKGIGVTSVEEILKLRKKYGNFENMIDFFNRLDSKKINKKTIEKLIVSGSMDCFKVNRATMYNYLINRINNINKFKIVNVKGQLNLIDHSLENSKLIYFIKNNIVEEWSEKKILKGEMESLGICITKNHIIKNLGYFYSNKILIKNIFNNQNVQFISIGIIVKLKKINYDNQKICILKINDYSNILKIIILQKELTIYKDLLNKYNTVLVSCKKILNRKDRYDVYLNNLIIIENHLEKTEIENNILIELNIEKLSDEILKKLTLYLDKYQSGQCYIIIKIIFPKGKEILYLKSFWKTNKNINNINEIKENLKN